MAEFSAAKLLDLKLAEARQAGYDAIDRAGRKVQIKGRCLPEKPGSGQRLGSIRLDHEWDSVLLVLLDDSYAVIEMWEADRQPIEAAIRAPGSKARNKRGALAVGQFKSIGTRVWPVNKP
ncbi:DUF6998 domain-containing protein [Marinobacter salsuginis]